MAVGLLIYSKVGEFKDKAKAKSSRPRPRPENPKANAKAKAMANKFGLKAMAKD